METSGNLPGYSVTGWAALGAPAGLPADLVAKLNGYVRETLAEPSVIERLRKLGAELTPTTPEAFEGARGVGHREVDQGDQRREHSEGVARVSRLAPCAGGSMARPARIDDRDNLDGVFVCPCGLHRDCRELGQILEGTGRTAARSHAGGERRVSFQNERDGVAPRADGARPNVLSRDRKTCPRGRLLRRQNGRPEKSQKTHSCTWARYRLALD